jgi:hypothetical protein
MEVPEDEMNPEDEWNDGDEGRKHKHRKERKKEKKNKKKHKKDTQEEEPAVDSAEVAAAVEAVVEKTGESKKRKASDDNDVELQVQRALPGTVSKLPHSQTQSQLHTQRQQQHSPHRPQQTHPVPSSNSSSSASSKSSLPSAADDVASSQPPRAKKVKASDWNFVVDYNDHFETPLVAYSDLRMSLVEIANQIRKKPEDLVLYDPYWCQGSMVERLRDAGFPHVINQNRDFYKDIQQKKVPGRLLFYTLLVHFHTINITVVCLDYDVLITNPPYSGEHKQKLIDYLKAARKPFALLLPVYTATKSYWKEFASFLKAASSSVEPLYLIPQDNYEYHHPEGTGKDIPPFFSSWFIGGVDPSTKTRSVIAYFNRLNGDF